MANVIIRKCTNCGREFRIVLGGEERTHENGHFFSTLCDSCWEKLHGKPRSFKAASQKTSLSESPKKQRGPRGVSVSKQGEDKDAGKPKRGNRVCDLARDLKMDPGELLWILRVEMGANVSHIRQELEPDQMAFVMEYVTQGLHLPGSVLSRLAIVAWNDLEFETFYVIELDDTDHITRSLLLKKCSETSHYYDDVESAEKAAATMLAHQEEGGEIRRIALSDLDRDIPEQGTAF